MLLNNPVADAQAEARAFTNTLGGVKRLKDAIRLLDPRPRIVEFGVQMPVFGIHLHPQIAALPAFQHGIHGVVDDVQENLLQLMRISRNSRNR